MTTTPKDSRAQRTSVTTLSSGVELAAGSNVPYKWFVSKIDARAEKPTDVLAAGAVVWRRTSEGDVQVLMEHRHRYGDWSIPKGKIDPCESPIATAVRELKEETGLDIRLGKFLRRVHYPLSRRNVEKVVYYWAAQAVGGTFFPNEEVDKIAWVSVAEAAELTNYETDKLVLRRFSKLDVQWTPLLLVRHGRAGEREFTPNDVLRQLDECGRDQAQMLTSACAAFGATALFSADRTRCEQTLEPTSHKLHLPVTIERSLSEESCLIHPEDTLSFVKELAQQSVEGSVPVVCSQGDVLPTVLEHLTERHIRLHAPRTKKGGMWVLFVDHHGVPRAADYYPNVQAVR